MVWEKLCKAIKDLSPEDRKAMEDAMKYRSASELLKAVRAETPFEDGEVSPALDDVVHDLKAEEAADIDNGGIERQVEFIMDTLGPEETVRILKEIIGG